MQTSSVGLTVSLPRRNLIAAAMYLLIVVVIDQLVRGTGGLDSEAARLTWLWFHWLSAIAFAFWANHGMFASVRSAALRTGLYAVCALVIGAIFGAIGFLVTVRF